MLAVSPAWLLVPPRNRHAMCALYLNHASFAACLSLESIAVRST